MGVCYGLKGQCCSSSRKVFSAIVVAFMIGWTGQPLIALLFKVNCPFYGGLNKCYYNVLLYLCGYQRNNLTNLIRFAFETI